MYQLVFNAATRTTVLRDMRAARTYVVTYEIEHCNAGAITAAQRLVEQRLRDFEHGAPAHHSAAPFVDINDLIRYRLLQCCFDWFTNNPWNSAVLDTALMACHPACTNPACEPCIVQAGLLNRGANTKIDAWAKCGNGQAEEIHVGFESETSHHNSAMWSLMRLNVASLGLVESSGPHGTKTAAGVLAKYPGGAINTVATLDLGVIAMWHDRLPGAKANQPTYEWWVRTRRFRPPTALPTTAVFVRLT